MKFTLSSWTGIARHGRVSQGNSPKLAEKRGCETKRARRVLCVTRGSPTDRSLVASANRIIFLQLSHRTTRNTALSAHEDMLCRGRRSPEDYAVQAVTNQLRDIGARLCTGVFALEIAFQKESRLLTNGFGLVYFPHGGRHGRAYRNVV